MKKYTVLSQLTGKRNRQFTTGEELTENDLPAGTINSLINRGFIREQNQFEIKPGEKIKLAIVTSVWGRPKIFEMFQQGVMKLRELCAEFDIVLVVSGSIQEDDAYKHLRMDLFEDFIKLNEFSNSLNEKRFFKYIEIPNEPLAAKVNATTYACRNLGVHYVLCMGSDDIMSPELLNEFAISMRKGIDFIGVTDGYFYDTVSKQALYWGGYREAYRKGHTLGAFRALSARLLSQWDWMPWENKDSHVLDKSMQDKLKVTPHTIHTFSMKEKGLFALDIKSSTNMTPFKKWDNSEFIDVQIIKQQFPYIF